MSQTLIIRFATEAPRLADFLRAWEQVGAWHSLDGDSCQLLSRYGGKLVCTRGGNEMEFTGDPGEDGLACIEAFSRQTHGELWCEGEPAEKGELVWNNVMEGEFIGAGEQRDEKLRGWGAQGGAAPFKALKLKPAHKAIALGLVLVFLPIALAALLLFMLVMFGRLAFLLLRLRLRG